MDKVLVNGKAYGFTDITVNVLGVPLIGITALKYGAKREKINNYALGSSEPVSRSSGKKEYEPVTMTIEKHVFAALKAIAPSGDVTRLPSFDIPVIYGDSPENLSTDIIQNFEFTSESNEANEGDTSLYVQLEGICAGIK